MKQPQEEPQRYPDFAGDFEPPSCPTTERPRILNSVRGSKLGSKRAPGEIEMQERMWEDAGLIFKSGTKDQTKEDDVKDKEKTEKPTKGGKNGDGEEEDSETDDRPTEMTELEEEEHLLKWQEKKLEAMLGDSRFLLPQLLEFKTEKLKIPRYGPNRQLWMLWDHYVEKAKAWWEYLLAMMPFSRVIHGLEMFPQEKMDKNAFVIKTPGSVCMVFFLTYCVIAFLYYQYEKIGYDIHVEFNFEPNYDSFKEPFRVEVYKSVGLVLAGYVASFDHRETGKIEAAIGRDVETEEEYLQLFRIGVNSTVNLRKFKDGSVQNCTIDFQMLTFQGWEETELDRTYYIYVPDWEVNTTTCHRQDVIEQLKEDRPMFDLGMLDLNFYFNEVYNALIPNETGSVKVYSPFNSPFYSNNTHETLNATDYYRELAELEDLNPILWEGVPIVEETVHKVVYSVWYEKIYGKFAKTWNLFSLFYNLLIQNVDDWKSIEYFPLFSVPTLRHKFKTMNIYTFFSRHTQLQVFAQYPPSTSKTKMMSTVLDLMMNFGGIYNIFKLLAGVTIGIVIFDELNRHVAKALTRHYYNFLGDTDIKEELEEMHQDRLRHRISLIGIHNFNMMMRQLIANIALTLDTNERIVSLSRDLNHRIQQLEMSAAIRLEVLDHLHNELVLKKLPMVGQVTIREGDDDEVDYQQISETHRDYSQEPKSLREKE